MNVYKYRGIDNFDRDLKCIVENKIYASPYIKLNDPFEGLCNEEISQFAIFLEKQFKANPKDVIRIIGEIKDFKSKLGIYSLSETYSEELIWAHYASSHKGFCIEYNTEKLKDEYLAPSTVGEYKVDYKPLPQTLTFEDIGNNNKIIIKLFATKSLKWTYENEVRLIFDSFGEKNHHSSALKGIYFGINMSQISKDELIESLKNRDVKFYEIYRESNSYDLNRRLVHENFRQKNEIDENSYEILKTKNNAKVEIFDVLYKSSNLDDESLNLFFENFRNNHSTKDCVINLYDDKSILHLIDEYPLSSNDSLKFAKHYIASTMGVTDGFMRYPFK